MNRKVKVESLAASIMDELENFADIETDEMKQIIKKVGKETAEELRQTSPKKTGAYAKHWASKTTYEDAKAIRVSVHARSPEYRKAHLLEKGHAKRNGGRVEGIPHVKPAEEKAIRKVEEGMKRSL